MVRVVREESAKYSPRRYEMYQRVYAFRFHEDGSAECEARDLPTIVPIPPRLKKYLKSLGRLQYCVIHDDDGPLSIEPPRYGAPETVPGRAFTVRYATKRRRLLRGVGILVYDRTLDEIICDEIDFGE